MGDGERDELLGTVNISRMTAQQFGTFVCTRRSGSMELSSNLHAGQQLRPVLVSWSTLSDTADSCGSAVKRK